MEDERILRKGKRSSLWFFSLLIGLVRREETKIFCYAKRPNVAYLDKPSGAFQSNLFHISRVFLRLVYLIQVIYPMTSTFRCQLLKIIIHFLQSLR